MEFSRPEDWVGKLYLLQGIFPTQGSNPGLPHGRRILYQLNHKYSQIILFELTKWSWAPTNWCFWTVVLEKNLESPLDCKEIQPVHCKGDQSWVFFGRTDAKAETPILWPPHEKSWLIGKDSDAGRDWGKEEKGMTEDEMAGWHHRLDGHEWVNSRSWWWTGRPGRLRFMGLQRVDWATELKWIKEVGLGRNTLYTAACTCFFLCSNYSWVFSSTY